jgi:hypothetical protein
MTARRIAIVTLMLLAAATPGVAGETSLSGLAAVEFRGFVDDPQFAGQLHGIQPSLLLSSELRYRTANRKNYFGIVPFLRVDGRDDERTHFDLREAYWRRIGKDWELLAGVNRVFWGVTESRHLVDVINQTDFVEDIDNEDKLGQPMINFSWQRNWGRLDAFALLGFRERTFPGVDGRLRPALVVDTDAARFESGAGDQRLDYALRYSHYFGDWDVGAYVFHGTGREPRLVPDLEADRLIPHYDVIRQFGVDLQYTRNAWLWKLETMVREGHGDSFAAAVGGFEYTLYQIGNGAADLGLLAEYLYDDRDANAPPTAFDDDIFVGSRLALNDTQNTEMLIGVVVDANDGSIAGRLEAERRIGQHLKLEIEGRFFTNSEPGNTLDIFRQDSFVAVRLSFFF